MAEPIYGVPYTHTISLVDRATGQYRVNPTIAAGDFKINLAGVLTPLATTPVVSPAGSIHVLLSFNAPEMTRQEIVLEGIDALGGEWDDVRMTFTPRTDAAVYGAGYLGDFDPGDLFDFEFETKLGGVLTSLLGSPVVAIYKNNSLTEVVANITLTVNYDGRTGRHHVRGDMDPDGAFFSAGSNFVAVLITGTLNGLTVPPHQVATLSLQNRSALMPETAKQRLRVLSGAAALHWGEIVNPTAVQNLSGTTVKNATDVLASVAALTSTFTTFTAGYLAAIWTYATRGLTVFTPAFWQEYLETEVEPGATVRKSHQYSNSASAAKASGMGTTNPKLRDIADTIDRIDSVTDANGNRSSVTRN